MKKILLFLIAAVAFAGLNVAQSQEKAQWKEMEAFHEVMAKTFHPGQRRSPIFQGRGSRFASC